MATKAKSTGEGEKAPEAIADSTMAVLPINLIDWLSTHLWRVRYKGHTRGNTPGGFNEAIIVASPGKEQEVALKFVNQEVNQRLFSVKPFIVADERMEARAATPPADNEPSGPKPDNVG